MFKKQQNLQIAHMDIYVVIPRCLHSNLYIYIYIYNFVIFATRSSTYIVGHVCPSVYYLIAIPGKLNWE